MAPRNFGTREAARAIAGFLNREWNYEPAIRALRCDPPGLAAKCGTGALPPASDPDIDLDELDLDDEIPF